MGRCSSTNHKGKRFVKSAGAVWWSCAHCHRQFCSECEGSDDSTPDACDSCRKSLTHSKADDLTDQELDDRIFARERDRERTR